MRSLVLTGISFALTAAVLGNAYFQKQQFYPSVVYITKSNPSMAILYVQAFVFVILSGKLMRKIFFGQLRAAEMEHLIERSWYAVTETCLAFTVFRDDFSPRFVALFTLLLFLKCFHWLAEDRVDYMERSPVISYVFHGRVISLLTFLGLVDLYCVNHAYYSTLLKGASVQLVFGFEYAILLTSVFMSFMKYVLHTIDLQSENPWEQKAVFILYTELVLGFVKVILYVAFMVIMIKVHTFPLFAIRPMYLAMRSFKKALHDVIMSRRAIRNMNTLYPDATAEELQSGDNVCIICREEMSTSCKKLPCNHIFHTSCLRSWFQRQQTCPTCRLDVLRMPRALPPARAPAAPVPPQQPPPIPNMFPGFPGMPGMPMWPPAMPAPAPPAAPAGQTPTSTATTSAPGTAPTFTTTPTAGLGSSPSMPPPPFSPFMPMMPPYSMMSYGGFPRPPSSLSGLTEEELKSMEGQERENIESRIQWLRDIQSLLDGAMVLMNQYNMVAAQSNISGINLSGARQPSADVSSQPGASREPQDGVSWSLGNPDEEESGAKPKSSTYTATGVRSGSPVYFKKEDSNLDLSGLEGATGYSPPKEEYIPEWQNTADEHIDEMHEVRKRRLQRFQSEGNSQTNSSDTNEKKDPPHTD